MPTLETRRRPSRGFLSLKWKALALTSVVFAALGATFSAITYVNLRSQFDRQRQMARENYRREAEALLAQSLLRLQQVATLVPALDGMGRALAEGDPERLVPAFDPHWGDLQLSWDLDFAQFYDAAGHSMGAWGVSGRDERAAEAPAWVREAGRSERPVSRLEGSDEWLQCAAVPLLLGGRSAGVAVVGTSLAGVVLELRQVSGADVALLALGGDHSAALRERSRHLAPWGARVLALTDAMNRLPVLQAAAERYPDPVQGAAGVRLEVQGRDYEVTLIPLQTVAAGGSAQLAVVADLSGALAEIRAATRASVYASAVGLVAFEAVLLALLWTPLRRVARTADHLPLLAHNAFTEVRAAIGEPRRRWGRDEIDVLDETAIGLSRQLEGLDRELTKKTRASTRQMEELQKERDFVRSLFDTAQVAILIVNGYGEIVTVNDFGQTLSGRGREDLAGAKLVDLVAGGARADEVGAQLADLCTGRRDQLRHEARLNRADGTWREVVWLHSRLRGRTGDSPVVLSVGLDVTEQKLAESRLAWLGDHDPLTGLLNRRRFEEGLEQTLAVARRYGREGAVLLLDLDQFKYVNDTSGHRAGDLLLTAVSEGLSRTVRSVDAVARLGGDEFAVLLRESDLGGAIEAAKKLLANLSGVSVPDGERRHRVSASVGIARFPRDADDVAGLMAAAEIAMYGAKESGRGGWHVFSRDDATRLRMHEHLLWKGRIEEALLNDGFLLLFQPILDLGSGRVTHYEALLRMRDGEGGLVSPGDFIGPAEKSGLIRAIDHLVLEKGIGQAGAFARAGHDVSVSVNLSAHAFEDPELLPLLADALRAYGVAPGRILFEITETAVVADLPAAQALIRAIRELGCRFALDDFGVGFSSFHYLKQFPVDIVKIDGSFIRHLREDPNDQILVQAMAQVARGFGKKTVAEYVESAEILAEVRAHGIDYAQGFHVGRPLSAAEILRGRGVPDGSSDVVPPRSLLV